MNLTKISLFSLCAISGVAQPITEDRMFSEVFGPVGRNIVNSYPIISLRQKFIDTVNDKSVILSLGNRASLKGQHGPLAFSAPRPNIFQPTVVIVYENFLDRMKYASSIKSQKEYGEYLEDLMLALYLHEYYHIKKQDMWRGSTPIVQIVNNEANCWAYTVREILVPMQAEGRAKLLPGTFEDTILSLYKSLKGNTSGKRWHDFFQESYGK